MAGAQNEGLIWGHSRQSLGGDIWAEVWEMYELTRQPMDAPTEEWARMQDVQGIKIGSLWLWWRNEGSDIR